ncbi:AtpZ/AtpI family protein [uncultured Cytophaga sp.]|uniref:AtpZ/AtpI family protein n=1 Tax=uncultured Cytophaga sp. TaxID=160238 RepID=UPI00262F3675|nr:AtpZ/AtpI family protein [uncultured Cytophaga sp.]
MNTEERKVKKSSLTGFSKYSAIGFQMIATICVFGAIGWWLDRHFNVAGKLNTVFFMLFGVIGSITKFIMDVINEQKRGE